MSRTKEQIVAEWRALVLSTEPIDTEKVEHEFAKIPLGGEKKIVWCDSPFTMALVHYAAKNKDHVTAGITASVLNTIADGILGKDDITRSLKRSLDQLRKIEQPYKGIGRSYPHFNYAKRIHVGGTTYNDNLTTFLDTQLFQTGDITQYINSLNTLWEESFVNFRVDWLGNLLSHGTSRELGLLISRGLGNRNQFFEVIRNQFVAFNKYLDVDLKLEGKERDTVTYNKEMLLLAKQRMELRKISGMPLETKNHVLMSHRPVEVRTDDAGRLHSESQAAISYADGFGIYSWHNIPVRQHVITNPGLITYQDIRRERNLELRRVLIERYGYDRYMKDVNSEEIGRDKYGILWRIREPHRGMFNVVEVDNSTKEPDGTRKKYFLRVPDRFTNPLAALAWTFDVTVDEYKKIKKAT